MELEDLIVAAQNLFAEKKNDEAAAKFAEAIAIDPDDPGLRTARGAALMAAGRHADALEEFDAGVRLAPDNARAWYRRGMARMALQDIEGAVADFTGSIDRDHQYGVAFYSRGMAYDSLGRDQEAQEDLRKAWVLGQTKVQGELDTYGIIRTDMDKS